MIRSFKVLYKGAVHATCKTIKNAREIRKKLMDNGYENIVIRVEKEDV